MTIKNKVDTYLDIVLKIVQVKNIVLGFPVLIFLS